MQSKCLKDWLGSHSREKAVRRRQKKQWREAFLWQRFVLITRKERKALKFQAKGGDKSAFFPWKWTIRKRSVVYLECYW